MNAPPPTPELCGSTSDSIACTAIAASTALPPRLRTLRPASAASGLAAMTNGSVDDSARAASAAGTDCCAGTAAHAVTAARATAAINFRIGIMRIRLAGRVAPAIVSAKDAAGSRAVMARQLERFENLVSMFFTRAEEKGDAPFLWAKRDGAWHAISWSEAARQVAALAASLKRIGLQPGDRVCLVSENRP